MCEPGTGVTINHIHLGGRTIIKVMIAGKNAIGNTLLCGV